MLIGKQWIGLALIAFGVGMILAIVLQSVLCRFLIGTICICVGCVCMK